MLARIAKKTGLAPDDLERGGPANEELELTKPAVLLGSAAFAAQLQCSADWVAASGSRLELERPQKSTRQPT